MSIGKLSVDERALMKHLTVEITVRRNWRCTVGLWLARIGLHLTGVRTLVTYLPEDWDDTR